MLSDKDETEHIVDQIIKELSDYALTKSHACHISCAKAVEIDLRVSLLEDQAELQGAVLSVHHSCIQILFETGVHKVIENHKGVAFIQIAQ